jgi:hypothetical protein
MRKRLVEFARLGLQDALADFNSGTAKLFKSLAADQRIGIAHGRHYASNSRREDCLRTRRGSPGVAARLKIQVESVAACQWTCFFQGEHFRVLAFGILMNPATDHSTTLVDHDGSDARVGRGKPHTLARQFERLCHEEFVCRASCHDR